VTDTRADSPNTEDAAHDQILFPGFSRLDVDVNDTTISAVRAGQGPPVLLLHGYPQTHVCWHRVAPALARSFTVVCADLRGYGDSGKPPSDPSHVAYSKRVMGQDQIELMQGLGFERFAVVGHDRGGRVARRMALDHPELISRLALLDIVPTRTIYAMLDRDRATAVWRYLFLIQPRDLPERLIGANTDFYLRWTFQEWSRTPEAITEAALAEYRRCFDEQAIHATCEDYRAGATIDLTHDQLDQDERVSCPLLIAWSSHGIGTSYDVLSIWREEADDVRGLALDCGHFLPEEQPARVAAVLDEFLTP
jgi:haloacetate dehalogenase